MPLEGHWARQRTPLRRREQRAVAAVLALVVAGLLVLLVAGRGGPASAPGCVEVTIASTTGGAVVHACGQRARHLCTANHVTREVLAACRRARIAALR